MWCPQRFIFDRTLRTVTKPLPHVYADEYRKQTVVLAGRRPDRQREAELEKQGVEVFPAPALFGYDWIPALREFCEGVEMPAVLLEGGPTLLSAFLRAREMNYLFAYRAPKFFADENSQPAFSGSFCERLTDAYTLADVRHATLGDDQLLRGRVVYP